MKASKNIRKTLSIEEKQRRAQQRSENVAKALARFDSMPGAALVRLPVVRELFGVSGPTIYRMVKAGKLEPPERIGARSSGFRVSSLRKALEVRHA